MSALPQESFAAAGSSSSVTKLTVIHPLASKSSMPSRMLPRHGFPVIVSTMRGNARRMWSRNW